MMHFMVSQMRESRIRRERELSQQRSLSSPPRVYRSRSLPRSSIRSSRPQSFGSSGRMMEIRPPTLPPLPPPPVAPSRLRSLSPAAPNDFRRDRSVLPSEDSTDVVNGVSGEALGDTAQTRSSASGTRNPATLPGHSSGILLRSEPPSRLSSTNGAEVPTRQEDAAQSSALFLMPQRTRRTFARPWRFHDIYSDWSLASIHRIFWISVACIHIGIFLLIIGGFFHKSPSGMASSLVSMGIFILSTGLAMYTLAKSIITARARQCQRVLQVVLDLVDPQNGERETSASQNGDCIVGVVDAPPPYEAPPPYPGEGSVESTTVVEPPTSGAVGGVVAQSAAQPVSPNPNQKSPNSLNLTTSGLPPTYSCIDIPEETNCDLCIERDDLPPAYSERP